jgi:hypothetical protein
MKRYIQIIYEVDWEEYDDVSYELLVEDMFDDNPLKDGVKAIYIKEIKAIMKIENL